MYSTKKQTTFSHLLNTEGSLEYTIHQLTVLERNLRTQRKPAHTQEVTPPPPDI